MPVWLNTIPPISPKVPRPNTRRWLIFLLFLLGAGLVLTLWFRTTDRTGFIFWFTALGLPFCLWGVLFGLRRLAYKIRQVAATSRDRERSVLMLSETRRGQRFAYLLDTQIETAAGQGTYQAINAIQKSVPLVFLTLTREGTQRIRYAPLAVFNQPDSDVMLSTVINDLVRQISPALHKVSPDIPCYCLIETESSLQKKAEEVLLSTLKKDNAQPFRIVTGQGLDAIDAWLDTRWEIPSLLLIFSLGHSPLPSENDGEAIATILLSNRISANFPDASRLHRPEKSNAEQLNYGLSQALLWGNIGPDTITGSWVTGAQLVGGASWNQACEDNHLQFSMTEDNKLIDQVLGNTGRAGSWLTIALADATLNKDCPQDARLVATQPQHQSDTFWMAVISRKTESKEKLTHV